MAELQPLFYDRYDLSQWTTVITTSYESTNQSNTYILTIILTLNGADVNLREKGFHSVVYAMTHQQNWLSVSSLIVSTWQKVIKIYLHWKNLCLFYRLDCLQCFDTVGRAAGRASILQKLSGEVLAWLSVWSEVWMICIWSSWCQCHPSSFASLKSRMVYLSGAGLPRLSSKKRGCYN